MNYKNYLKPNFVIWGLLLLTSCYIVFTSIAGAAQNQVFDSETQTFQVIKEDLGNGDFNAAFPLVSSLLQKHPNNTEIMFFYATCSAGTGQFEQAERYFQRVKNDNPYIVKDYNFLVQYGQTLGALGKYTRARKYLVQAVTLAPELSDQINSLIDQIDLKIKH
jgi:tetratricopeptide (TPR) repeat protein